MTRTGFSIPGFATSGGTYRSRSAGLARLLDSQFEIPGTKFRVGLDAAIGLIPGIGDTISAALGSLVIAEAVQLGVRKPVIAKMVGNLAIDWAVGLVPVLGDIFDVVYKANMRNVALLERELETRGVPPRAHPGRGDVVATVDAVPVMG